MKNEKGYSLIEVLISIVLLGIIVTAFLSALISSSNAMVTADKLATAKNVAESQMEFVKKQQYALTYSPAPIPAEYEGYSAAITTQTMRDSNIEKISVLVKYHNLDVITLEDYKVKR
jgi:prepilin-type N-terminal cleavage/methylation domain-containing protein